MCVCVCVCVCVFEHMQCHDKMQCSTSRLCVCLCLCVYVQCHDKTQCFTCWPGAEGCAPVFDYSRLVVSEHGNITGREQMKAEIFARGPISCGIKATDNMDAYTGESFLVEKSVRKRDAFWELPCEQMYERARRAAARLHPVYTTWYICVLPDCLYVSLIRFSRSARCAFE